MSNSIELPELECPVTFNQYGVTAYDTPVIVCASGAHGHTASLGAIAEVRIYISVFTVSVLRVEHFGCRLNVNGVEHCAHDVYSFCRSQWLHHAGAVFKAHYVACLHGHYEENCEFGRSVIESCLCNTKSICTS